MKRRRKKKKSENKGVFEKERKKEGRKGVKESHTHDYCDPCC